VAETATELSRMFSSEAPQVEKIQDLKERKIIEVNIKSFRVVSIPAEHIRRSFRLSVCTQVSKG
jgi:hypothetical protein